MDQFEKLLEDNGFKGEIDMSEKSLETYSHDASLFEIKPQMIVFPKDSDDVKKIVSLVADNKHKIKDLSLTARSAGTCMSGGAVNDSIIMDFNRHFTNIENVTDKSARAQPGVFFRDFYEETRKNLVFMPSYPASRNLCTIGGMVANNAGGERSLEFGKTENFVEELKVVFSDGNEYVVRPLNKIQLVKKMAQKDFEGELYRKTFDLCEKHYDSIKSAKPNVSKNSMGYNLWDVWDRETGIFDLCKLIVGSQGTLGFVTDIKFRMVPIMPNSGLLVLFLKDIDDLGEIIPKVLESKPSTFESFDDATLKLAIRFMPSFLKTLGLKKFLHLLISLMPDGLQLLRGVPKLVLMVEFNGATPQIVREKIHNLHQELGKHRARYEINGFEEDPTYYKSEKFWILRHESFNLLRSKVKDKHTAPFIDDFVVNPEYLTEFLPKMRKIITKYKLLATVAGHMGDGNFHIIPLMKLDDLKERAKLLPAMKEVDNLVLEYKGSLSGEHNDGLVRGPWLKDMYGATVLGYFKKVKEIFDKDNIFNPHKKSDADWDYSFSHIRDNF